MYFDLNHKYPKLKKKIQKSFEHKSHFPYIEVYYRLTHLINELPSERLGRDGIYFQDDYPNETLDILIKIIGAYN